MKKLSLFSLTALTAMTIAGGAAMTSQAAMNSCATSIVFSGSRGNSNCNSSLNNMFGCGTNSLVQSCLNGSLKQNCFQNGSSCGQNGNNIWGNGQNSWKGNCGNTCQDNGNCGNTCKDNGNCDNTCQSNGNCDNTCQGNGDCNVGKLPSLPGTNQPAPSLPGDSNTDNSSYANQVLDLVNAERAKAGVAPLTLNASAVSAADIRAKEIANSFSHTRPDGKSFSTALTEAGIRFTASGENIAYGQNSAQEVMKGWMASTGHRQNILSTKYSSIGIGHYKSANGVNYWTQVFFN